MMMRKAEGDEGDEGDEGYGWWGGPRAEDENFKRADEKKKGKKKTTSEVGEGGKEEGEVEVGGKKIAKAWKVTPEETLLD